MLTRLRLENFKSWEDTGDIALKPITGFFGPNSSGKSSLFQALLLMKQTADSGDPGAVFHFGNEKTLVDLGDFESVVHKHDTERTLKFSLGWKSSRQIMIPESYDGRTVAEGDAIGFEVEAREGDVDSGESPVLQEMSYWTADQWFGMRRLTNQTGYDMFSHESDLEISSYTSEDRRVQRLSKFHRFPSRLYSYSQDASFLRDFELQLARLLRHLYYLGPLRASPNRIYARSGARPFDMGPAGEFVVDAILSSRERRQGILRDLDSRRVTIDKYVAGWLKRLKLVHDFRIEALADGLRIYEVKVRKSPNSAEVLLTDVGFGVSQILPVLVLCFYAPRGSTLILEQPDIHLHPSVQAGLADVFIDAWKRHNVQILFESHSEHLLRRLQRRIAEEEIPEDDIGLFFCSTGDSGASNLSQLEVDEFGSIANWPKDFFGDQFGEIAAMSEACTEEAGGLRVTTSKTEVVIDTNVAVVANGRTEQASPECILNCQDTVAPDS